MSTDATDDGFGDNGADPDDLLTYPPARGGRGIDDPSLAELEQAVADAELRLGRALELEAQAWDNMREARDTVARALADAQRARARYRVLRVNARPPT